MPTSAPAKQKECALRLLAFEASNSPHPAKDSPAFRVCEKLRGPLGKLMGVGGFRAILTRALVLAGAKVAWLRSLQVNADGSLEGLEAVGAKHVSRAIADGEVALVSELLGLLGTFIGPALTLRLLHDIWPQMEKLNL